MKQTKKRKLIDVEMKDVAVIAAFALTQGLQFKPYAEKVLADKAKQIRKKKNVCFCDE